jgi:hypothetical protein
MCEGGKKKETMIGTRGLRGRWRDKKKTRRAESLDPGCTTSSTTEEDGMYLLEVAARTES